jgi:hypothetical protein
MRWRGREHLGPLGVTRDKVREASLRPFEPALITGDTAA